MMQSRSWRYSPRTPPPVPLASEPASDYLIDAASQAPSGDNCQPWRFHTDGEALDIFLDSNADRSFFNIDQLASIIACGCAIENVRIAATAVGRHASVEPLPDGTEADRMATISFSPSTEPPDPLHDVIWTRNTNRKPYDKTSVPPENVEALRSAAKGPGDHDTALHVVQDPATLAEIAQIIFHVDRIRTEHQGLHEHFMRMVRFTQRDAERTRDGLPLPNLEAGLSGDLFLKTTRPWRVMKIANRLGAGKTIASFARQGILASAGVALLVSRGSDTRAALEGGRALGRTWLTATHLGLQVQPMTAITLFRERWRRGGRDDFSHRHRRLLSSIWPTYQAAFPHVDFDHTTHVMLFRFGYGSSIAYGTYRKPINGNSSGA